jgi:hypothetical protein
MAAEQYNLFETAAATATADDYEAFVEKFKTKKTTDDCYTPKPVYDVVMQYVKEHCDIEGCRVLRPFYPGGNYQAVAYESNDVVIDNPPFSILAEIVRYYTRHKVRFFLFAPALTFFSSAHKNFEVTKIVTGATVIYENGANVCTSFLTNMWGDGAVIVDGDLCRRLNALKTPKAKGNKIRHPLNVISAAVLQRLAQRGISITFSAKSLAVCSKLDNYSTGVFGGGYFISDRAAAERAAAERAAAERAAAERAAAERAAEVECYYIPLSEKEKYIISTLE